MFLLPLFVLPYHETLRTTGMITRENETYIMMAHIPTNYVADMWDAKMVIQRKKYDVHVQEFFYDKTKGQYSFFVEIDMRQNIRVENVPVDITFEFKETTLLKQLKQTMKGWFL